LLLPSPNMWTVTHFQTNCLLFLCRDFDLHSGDERKICLVFSTFICRPSSLAKSIKVSILNLGVCILLRVLDQVQGFPSNSTLFWIFYSVTETCSGYWIKYSKQCCIRRKPWTWP
jgi:hypothetical protein